MVSLQSVDQPGSGVTFFSDSLTSSHHDDEPLLGSMPVLPREPPARGWVSEEMKKFRSIRTPPAIILAKVLYVCLGVSAYLIPIVCNHHSNNNDDDDNSHSRCQAMSSTSLVSVVHGAMWLLLLGVEVYLRQEHDASLLHGYFTFHLHTLSWKRAPLLINTAANVVMLVLSQVLEAVCQSRESCPLMPRVRYFQLLVTTEVVVALVVLSIYLVKTLRFNRARQVPDFLRSSPSPRSAQSQREIGFRAPFDLQTWALGECWEEVFQLRQGCRHLWEERGRLHRRLRDHGASIN